MRRNEHLRCRGATNPQIDYGTVLNGFFFGGGRFFLVV